ncbi:SLC25A40 family protein [Megaselia abdita]
MEDERFRIRPHQQICSAITGAVTTSLFMTPLDVVKTRIQTQQKALVSNKCFLYCNGLMDHLCPCPANGNGKNGIRKPVVQLNGTVDAILKISRAEGVYSLWSGLGPTLVSALPSTVIYFVAYEQIKRQMTSMHHSFYDKSSDKMPLYVPLMSGVLARIFAVTAVSPIELIRTKMQSQKLSYSDLSKAIKELVRNEGVIALWKGLPPTVLRDVPFSGIYWTCYESIKGYFNVTTPTFQFSFLAGAAAGMISAFVTTPFDVIKTHRQIEFGEKVIYTSKKTILFPVLQTKITFLFRQSSERSP